MAHSGPTLNIDDCRIKFCDLVFIEKEHILRIHYDVGKAPVQMMI